MEMAIEKSKEKFTFSSEVTVNRMGIGGYVFGCPSTKTLQIVQKLPKANSIVTCEGCGKTHKILHGRTKHFSHYL